MKRLPTRGSVGNVLLLLMSASACYSQNVTGGKTLFGANCAVCHGADANGGELGPPIRGRIPAHTDKDLARLIHEGIPNMGMPGHNLNEAETSELVTFLHSFGREGGEIQQQTFPLTDGSVLRGHRMNSGLNDLQVMTDKRRLVLLRKAGDRYRVVTSQSDWLTYNGDERGNRFSSLRQIDRSNVAHLAPQWVFPLNSGSRLEVTPVVANGIMYVTAANQCFALDAGSGRQIWHFERPRTNDLVGNAASGINRGVALAGDKVFMVTDNAHLIALNRWDGTLLWDSEMADWRQNYNATSAPLTVGHMVISGTAGGDEGARGFLAAYDQSSGKEVWRLWTTPLPGEPGSETWGGPDIQHPGAVTWMTGTYDPELNILYWPTGNPGNDMNGDDRAGDNLYSSCILAIDPTNGHLRWHYQYTPHNLWDWDGQEPPVLIDTNWEGHPRKLLLNANRNGFFYVLDRTNGKLLLAEPYVKKLNWARGIGRDGRPILNPNIAPTPQGTKVCPSLSGAANWFSTAFDPDHRLYYVQTLERCDLFTKQPSPWRAGAGYFGGAANTPPGEIPQKILRAIDIQTGKRVWEMPQAGPGDSGGGVLATAGGLVFVGEDDGSFTAVDSLNGKRLWTFPTNAIWRASPMTFQFDRKQYIAVASTPNIFVFGLNGESAGTTQ